MKGDWKRRALSIENFNFFRHLKDGIEKTFLYIVIVLAQLQFFDLGIARVPLEV
jgi:hypothetical protein